MRNLTTVLTVAIVAGLGFAGAANADTATYNKYTNTNTYGGYTETNVDAHVSSTGVQKTVETSTKIEAIAE